MAKLDTKALMEDIRKQLGDRVTADMGKFDADDLADAVAHPEAPAVIAELMEREKQSVSQGEPAPDFKLPWLPGSDQGSGSGLTLSDHFGDRPVALIFGSYT